MQMQGRRLEVIFPSDTDTDLVDDFIAVITRWQAESLDAEPKTAC